MFRPKPIVEPGLTVDEAKALLQKIKDGDIKTCAHCAGIHARACPRVRKMTFVGDEIREISFWRDDKYNNDDTIWPSDLQEVADREEA
jgi:hypothetical protein